MRYQSTSESKVSGVNSFNNGIIALFTGYGIYGRVRNLVEFLSEDYQSCEVNVRGGKTIENRQ